MKKISALLLCLSLCACGFHLRGLHPLSPSLSPMLLDRNHVSADVVMPLQQALRQNGVTLTDAAKTARTQLHLISVQFSQSAAELGSNTQWRRFTLRYAIAFQLLGRHAKPLSAPDEVAVLRQFTENPNQRLGSDNERRTLKNEMRQEAIALLLARLQSQQLNPKPQ